MPLFGNKNDQNGAWGFLNSVESGKTKAPTGKNGAHSFLRSVNDAEIAIRNPQDKANRDFKKKYYS